MSQDDRPPLSIERAHLFLDELEPVDEKEPKREYRYLGVLPLPDYVSASMLTELRTRIALFTEEEAIILGNLKVAHDRTLELIASAPHDVHKELFTDVRHLFIYLAYHLAHPGYTPLMDVAFDHAKLTEERAELVEFEAWKNYRPLLSAWTVLANEVAVKQPVLKTNNDNEIAEDPDYKNQFTAANPLLVRCTNAEAAAFLKHLGTVRNVVTQHIDTHFSYFERQPDLSNEKPYTKMLEIVRGRKVTEGSATVLNVLKQLYEHVVHSVSVEHGQGSKRFQLELPRLFTYLSYKLAYADSVHLVTMAMAGPFYDKSVQRALPLGIGNAVLHVLGRLTDLAKYTSNGKPDKYKDLFGALHLSKEFYEQLKEQEKTKPVTFPVADAQGWISKRDKPKRAPSPKRRATRQSKEETESLPLNEELGTGPITHYTDFEDFEEKFNQMGLGNLTDRHATKKTTTPTTILFRPITGEIEDVSVTEHETTDDEMDVDTIHDPASTALFIPSSPPDAYRSIRRLSELPTYDLDDTLHISDSEVEEDDDDGGYLDLSRFMSYPRSSAMTSSSSKEIALDTSRFFPAVDSKPYEYHDGNFEDEKDPHIIPPPLEIVPPPINRKRSLPEQKTTEQLALKRSASANRPVPPPLKVIKPSAYVPLVRLGEELQHKLDFFTSAALRGARDTPGFYCKDRKDLKKAFDAMDDRMKAGFIGYFTGINYLDINKPKGEAGVPNAWIYFADMWDPIPTSPIVGQLSPLLQRIHGNLDMKNSDSLPIVAAKMSLLDLLYSRFYKEKRFPLTNDLPTLLWRLRATKGFKHTAPVEVVLDEKVQFNAEEQLALKRVLRYPPECDCAFEPTLLTLMLRRWFFHLPDNKKEEWHRDLFMCQHSRERVHKRALVVGDHREEMRPFFPTCGDDTALDMFITALWHIPIEIDEESLSYDPEARFYSLQAAVMMHDEWNKISGRPRQVRAPGDQREQAYLKEMDVEDDEIEDMGLF